MKQIDPKDTYVVRQMFGCGEGHALPPGFTHWESGEGCIHGHSGIGKPNEYYHLYWRLYLVPVYRGTKEDPYSPENGKVWDRLLSNPNKWGQFVPAPEGLREGQTIGPSVPVGGLS